MLDHVVVGEGLFDQQQAEVVQLGELLGVDQGVGGVGVDLEEQVVTEAFADGADGFDVPAGFDLQQELCRRLDARNRQSPFGAVPITREMLEGYVPFFDAPGPNEATLFDEPLS